MRYINCSRWEEEQNLLGIQYFGAIRYRVYKTIKPGDELLVYYGEEYAKDLGIAINEDEEPVNDVSNEGIYLFSSLLNVHLP